MSDTDPYRKIVEEYESKLKHIEEERRNAEEGRRIAGERQRDTEKELRQTAFAEFIKYCHLYFSKPIQLQRDPTLATQGPLTKPANRFHPTYLIQWIDFPRLQQEVYSNVFGFFIVIKDPLSRRSLRA